jgi:hypothetical protein
VHVAGSISTTRQRGPHAGLEVTRTNFAE